MEIQAKEIRYDSNAITKEQFEAHKKLYTGYVGKVNEITKDLKTMPKEGVGNAAYSLYRGLKKGETYSMNGVILHELYFQNMSTEKTKMSQKTESIIKKGFGTYEKWVEDFKACGMSARGWCIFVYEQRTDTFRNILLDQHDVGLIAYVHPLIILDMYEHAYFYDYKTNKEEYIMNFIKSIDWNIVNKRVEFV